MGLHGICFTWNNYPDGALQILIRSVGTTGIKYLIAGHEVGDSGTPHLQGYLQSNHDMFKRFKTAWGCNSIHFEKQKGDSKEAADYCKKDGDFLEAGQYAHIESPKKRQGARSDLAEIQERITAGDTYETLCETHFTQMAKYSRFIKERVSKRDELLTIQELAEKFEQTSPRPWQKTIIDLVETPPSKRKIHWVWDPYGNVGKSWMASYLAVKKAAIILEGGKKADMAYIWAQKPGKVAVFDLSRTQESFLDGVYSLAESLKNGRVVSTKYESKSVCFEVPHVIIFANFEPDRTKWSDDRYDIIRVGA